MPPAPTDGRAFVIVGPGRAGLSFQTALERRGWTCHGVVGRDFFEAEADGSPRRIEGSRLTSIDEQSLTVIIAVPDNQIAMVAQRIAPGPIVVHLSGAIGLDALDPHVDAASIHPLMSLPDVEIGSVALLRDGHFGLASRSDRAERVVHQIVGDFGGHGFPIADGQRAIYHAAAVVATNHLSVLCGQVERLSRAAGVPTDAFWPIMRSVIDNVAANGAAASLTGPVARADWDTVARHLAALPPAEHDLYLPLARGAAHLAGRELPIQLR